MYCPEIVVDVIKRSLRGYRVKHTYAAEAAEMKMYRSPPFKEGEYEILQGMCNHIDHRLGEHVACLVNVSKRVNLRSLSKRLAYVSPNRLVGVNLSLCADTGAPVNMSAQVVGFPDYTTVGLAWAQSVETDNASPHTVRSLAAMMNAASCSDRAGVVIVRDVYPNTTAVAASVVALPGDAAPHLDEVSLEAQQGLDVASMELVSHLGAIGGANRSPREGALVVTRRYVSTRSRACISAKYITIDALEDCVLDPTASEYA